MDSRINYRGTWRFNQPPGVMPVPVLLYLAQTGSGGGVHGGIMLGNRVKQEMGWIWLGTLYP